jgi:uncharacterized protein YjbI with pentapeptide repeats
MVVSDDSSDSAPDDGDRSLAGTPQQGRDLMFAELAGVDLTEADFYWALFHSAILEGAVMTRCDLRGSAPQ